MTSIILAQKLASVKLSKESFEKLTCLIANNTEEKLRMVPYLETIINNQKQTKPCRICLKPSIHKIFNYEEFDCARTMKNLLGIEVHENDGKPQHICSSCETTLKDAERLKQTAELTQWRLEQEFEMITGTHLEPEVKNHHGSYLMEEGKKMFRKWSCGKCQRTFDNQESFTDHDKLLTCGREKQIFVCETCGMELRSLSRLKSHSLIHTARGTKLLQCKFCSRTFQSSSNLYSHRLTHLPPKYHCDICEGSYRFKQTLINHIASQHSAAKPHECNMCGKAFSTRKMLLRHERSIHQRPNLRPGFARKHQS